MPEPRVCETCIDWQREERKCRKHGEVPEDVQSSEDACADWLPIPF